MALQSRLICARIQTREAELKCLQAESAAELKRLSGAVLVRAFRGGIMSVVKPFGNVNTATILVIGHDPRLQRSQAEAEVAFFLDYLARPRPASRSEARKYDLAQAVRDYVNELAGREVPPAELYVTNLCNEFLNRPSGQVQCSFLMTWHAAVWSGLHKLSLRVTSRSFSLWPFSRSTTCAGWALLTKIPSW